MTERAPIGQFKLTRIPAQYINLRAAPATDSGVVARLRLNDVLTLFDGEQGGWCYADIAGVRGWVSRQGGKVRFEAEETPAPSLIIDVSSNNGEISWVRAKAAGVGEAYIRATMGGAGVDTQADYNARGAWNTGVSFGFYALFRPDGDGVPQAKHALRITRAYNGKATLPLAVDVERVVAPKRVLSKAQYADQLAAFVQYVQVETGVYPVIYSSVGEWNALVGKQHDGLFAQCDLWVANYGVSKPTLPRCWQNKGYVLWQYSSSGRIDGINSRVDLNRRNQ